MVHVLPDREPTVGSYHEWKDDAEPAERRSGPRHETCAPAPNKLIHRGRRQGIVAFLPCREWEVRGATLDLAERKLDGSSGALPRSACNAKGSSWERTDVSLTSSAGGGQPTRSEGLACERCVHAVIWVWAVGVY